jgi:branched-chain amino acid transport system ATP-binding protein
MLEVAGLHAGYGETRVLHGLSFTAKPGRVTAILGRNGAGKSTTLKTIMGLLPATDGGVTFDGIALVGPPTRSPSSASPMCPRCGTCSRR